MVQSAIVVDGLVRRYGAFTAVDRVSFTVRSGTVFGLLGRNGAGKTTTLECCIGLGRPTAGMIRVLNLDPTSARDAAYYGIASRAEEMAERVGLSDRLDRRVAQMSGGEQQRLALALARRRTTSRRRSV